MKKKKQNFLVLPTTILPRQEETATTALKAHLRPRQWKPIFDPNYNPTVNSDYKPRLQNQTTPSDGHLRPPKWMPQPQCTPSPPTKTNSKQRVHHHRKNGRSDGQREQRHQGNLFGMDASHLVFKRRPKPTLPIYTVNQPTTQPITQPCQNPTTSPWELIMGSISSYFSSLPPTDNIWNFSL